MGHFGTSVCRFGMGGDRRQDDKAFGQQVEVAIKLAWADTACGGSCSAHDDRRTAVGTLHFVKNGEKSPASPCGERKVLREILGGLAPNPQGLTGILLRSASSASGAKIVLISQQISSEVPSAWFTKMENRDPRKGMEATSTRCPRIATAWRAMNRPCLARPVAQDQGGLMPRTFDQSHRE
jgi:hypothetical protein